VPTQELNKTVESVHEYWNAHTLGKQYVRDPNIEVGTKEYFDHIRPWMNPWKFPEIMPRIDKVAQQLKGKHLLEIGCGMGFDGSEFMKRGVKVTVTDLTPAAIEMAKKHHAIIGVEPEAAQTENVLNLSFPDNTFDAVWACGVLHVTGDTEKAISEVRRVLKPGGLAVVSHLYRRPSWMYFISKLGKENIEFKELDPPVNDFMTEDEYLAMFKGFKVEEAVQDHYRALPVCRSGVKAFLYTYVFKPVYNLLPEPLAKKWAYKLSVTATKV